MDKALRNALRNIVGQCRRALEASTTETLEGKYGVHDSGHVEDASSMGHLAEEERGFRERLLGHLSHIKATGFNAKEAVEQLKREIAFTHLNRLCAYKMMESRGLIRETVSRGTESQGFDFYLAEHKEDEQLARSGDRHTAHRHYLESIGTQYEEEVPALFSSSDPANQLFPPQRVMQQVLDLINSDELESVWKEDETLGWVYQYFTPKEQREKARKHGAPRNSYELAFRNQFYTPRYVVQFLSENTLGRMWYEMRKGETALVDTCEYLVRLPNEVFLAEGEQEPERAESREELSQRALLNEPVYIEQRPKKDPREIRVLDPACGSGHFLLYCFDLLETIYQEAYDDPDLGEALRKDYPEAEAFQREIPCLILKNNLHGIDIDLRAAQIASLALWLRAQPISSLRCPGGMDARWHVRSIRHYRSPAGGRGTRSAGSGRRHRGRRAGFRARRTGSAPAPRAGPARRGAGPRSAARDRGGHRPARIADRPSR